MSTYRTGTIESNGAASGVATNKSMIDKESI